MAARLPVVVVPVSVRFEPVVAAMGSTGGGFWRVARMNQAMPATVTTAPPISTATSALMAPEATRLAGPAARCKVAIRSGQPVTQSKDEHMSVTLSINGTTRTADVDPDTPLLWVLRDSLGLPGTKYGCGMALCGACTVHIDGEPVRSCSTPISAVVGKNVTTIEGLAKSPTELHPLQRAWIEHDVPQ